tara:strand:- start:308 stop:2152 length:1845 start_codon:yes stop_codon:yes gene_type:complete
MAQLFPDYNIIKKQKQKATQGELKMLDSLVENLDDNFEIYWQPYLNGDQPDIVVVRPKSGILIIEVKDWDLNNYLVDSKGRWHLKSINQIIKSPLSQINKYKWNMISLHIGTLLEKTIKNKGYFSLINRLLFFSKNKENEVRKFFEENYESKKLMYIELFGSNSLTSNRIQTALSKARLEADSNYFDNQLYLNTIRYLQPPFHQKEDGKKINYTKSQKLLINSEANDKKKIAGVAGSGKTLVMAKRAVNAHIRTGKKVLVLCYNIALKNYIHDRINDVREKFDWKEFEIINYHQFFLSQANNHNLMIEGLDQWQNVNFFRSVKDNIRKYDSIFIDEVQDYDANWLKIITKYFLKKDSEFVVFGDEKQNIYNTELDENKKPVIPTIKGAWNKSLRENYRFVGNLAQLAVGFQNEFLKDKYEKDEFILSNVAQEEAFENKQIEYYYFKTNNYGSVYDMVMQIVKENAMHPSDICIIDSRIKGLREIEYRIRHDSKEKTTTTFETQEIYEHLSKKLKGKNFQDKLEEIRGNKKFHFYMKTGTMKLSTIYSFKGWEIPALILIIHDLDQEEKDKRGSTSEELIYTGITRARFSLFIFNIGKEKYDNFFRKEIEASYDA